MICVSLFDINDCKCFSFYKFIKNQLNCNLLEIAPLNVSSSNVLSELFELVGSIRRSIVVGSLMAPFCLRSLILYKDNIEPSTLALSAYNVF